MGLIFIGHASANNAEALAVRDWLVACGWDDIFLDLDPSRGLVAGERWQAALKSAAERCELVLFLISPQWVASKWCLAEFLLAKQINKQIFGVIVEPTRLEDVPVEMTSEWQLVDLTAGVRGHKFEVLLPPGNHPTTVAFSEQGLSRLRIGLQKAGLEPGYFPWPPESDPNRSPYRGLRPLEAEDAGVFFGRDGPIVVGLDLLRDIRDAASPQVLVILGASGSGKSSFMRAGLLPRLARDDFNFLPLPVVRPERAVITGEAGFVASLEGALAKVGLSKNRADIRAAVRNGGEPLRALLTELVETRRLACEIEGGGQSKLPTIVVAVDQAEEIFHTDSGEEAAQFLSLLRDMVGFGAPAVTALFAIRTDGYERLQTTPHLEEVRQQFLNLPPMPAGAFGEVINGPARRLAATRRAIKIDERLVNELLFDIEAGGAKDALPLLAFTLERLYREYGGDGDITLPEYEALGRIRGSIEAAVESALRVADANPAIPRDRVARLSLLRHGLIPWLAGIDLESGAPRRRVARMSEIPREARPLIELLIDQRLLSTDVDADTKEVTVEPAHEALLRQWGLLEGWLEEDFPVLATLEGVRRATRDWSANAKSAEWLVHAGARLRDAEAAATREGLADLLQPTERSYLAAARSAEGARQQAEIRALRRQRGVVLAAAAILAVAAASLYGLWTVAEASFREASATLGVVRSQSALRDDDIEGAIDAAFGAMATLDSVETRSAALGALMELSPNLEAVHRLGADWPTAVAWPANDTLAVATKEGAVRFLPVATQETGSANGGSTQLAERLEDKLTGVPLSLHPWKGGVTAVLEDGSIAIVAGRMISPNAAPAATVSLSSGQHSVDASADSSLIAEALVGKGVLLRSCRIGPAETAPSCRDRTIPARNPTAVATSAKGARLAVGDEDGVIALYGLTNKAPPVQAAVGARVLALDWSPGKDLVAAGTDIGELLIVDGAAGANLNIRFRRNLSAIIPSVRWSPSAAELAFVCESTDICILSEAAGGSATPNYRVSERLVGRGDVTGMRWSPDGRRLASISADNTLRIWSRAQNRDARFALKTGRGIALRSAAFDRAGRRLAAGDGEGGIWIFDETGDDVRAIDPPEGPRAAVVSLAWGENGLLAAVYEGSGVAIWDPETNAPRRREVLANAVFSRVSWVGDRAAVPLRDGRIALIGAEPSAPVVYLGPLAEPKKPWGLTAHPDGRRLFASYTDGSIHIWDVTSGSHAGPFIAAEQAGPGGDGAGSLAVSADGRWLAATRNDAFVVAYDIEGGQPARRLAVDAAVTKTVAFAPSGTRLAALGSDGRLYVWDLAETDAPRMVAVPAVPDRSEAGRSATRTRRASWLTWYGDDRLAIPTIVGEVEVLVLDAVKWRTRAELLRASKAE